MKHNEVEKKFPVSGEECVHCSVYFSFGLNERGAGGEITFGGTNPERYIDPLVYHPIYDYYGMYVFFGSNIETVPPSPSQ